MSTEKKWVEIMLLQDMIEGYKHHQGALSWH